MRRLILVGLMLSSVLAAGSGCNRRVFQEVLPTCDGTIADATDIEAEKAADILIVIDNSGSMQEEQDRLAAAFINDNPAECPIPSNELSDFTLCDSAEPPAICRFSNPSADLLNAHGPEGLGQCGFIQVIAAFENDFRIGVITTDVGVCDNRFPLAQGAQCLNGFCLNGDACGPGNSCPNDWGFRPQRGCLQPDGPLGTTRKIISRQDLLDDDLTNDNIGQRFSDTLANIRTFGTGIERGLDAVDMFLDPQTVRDDRCANDLESFIREDAKLVVIFLTDEEDCSRSPAVERCVSGACDTECTNPDGCDLFVCREDQSCEPGMSEFLGESCGLFPEHINLTAARCYDSEANLTPVKHYVDRLKAKKADPTDVSVAVIAGGLFGADGLLVADGCRFNEVDGKPEGGCKQAEGLSTSPEVCGPDDNCCFADPGGRYFDLASALGPKNGLKDTICVDNFSQTMIKIAVFIGEVDSLTLAEKPEDESLMVVEKAPAGSDVFAVVPRGIGTSCEGAGDGWILEGADGLKVRFCGSQRPLPGERIRVSAKGKGANGEGPDACEGRGNVPAN